MPTEEEINKHREACEKYGREEKRIYEALNSVSWINYELLLYDTWTEEQGLLFLAGINRFEELRRAEDYIEQVQTLTTKKYENEGSDEAIFDAFVTKHERLKAIWESGEHQKRNTPEYYVKWALSKEFEIPWLEHAQRSGFFKSLNNHKQGEYISANERNTMLRIIAALSVGGYRYPSRGSQAEMLRDFQANGMAIDDKTLSKYLKQAETYLPSKLDSA